MLAYQVLFSQRYTSLHAYEVSLNVKSEQLLDFHKPLLAQTPEIQRAIERSGLLDMVMKEMGFPGYDTRIDSHMLRGLAGDILLRGDDPAKAAKALSAAGIPGVRYGNGAKQNYVVFPGNESLIQITSKNGISAGPRDTAAAAALPERTGKYGSRLEDAGLRKVLGQMYEQAVKGDDLSSQFDILNGRLNNDRSMPQPMRERMEMEVQRVASELGDDWFARYSPDSKWRGGPSTRQQAKAPGAEPSKPKGTK